jgi:hypothetical protein
VQWCGDARTAFLVLLASLLLRAHGLAYLPKPNMNAPALPLHFEQSLPCAVRLLLPLSVEMFSRAGVLEG